MEHMNDNTILNKTHGKIMRDKNSTSVVSYGYLSRAVMNDTEVKKSCTVSNTIIDDTIFEDDFLKNNNNSKKIARPNLKKSSSQCYSDVESDVGSDGGAANSGGSGRSGDWVPPKRRVKAKSRKKSNSYLTDSGISLSKDTESLSELTLQQRGDVSIYGSGEAQSERFYDTTSSTPAKNVATQPRRISLRRSSSLSALPSNIKPLDRHNPRLSSRRGSSFSTRRGSEMISAEDKVNAILQQCYVNEGIIPTTEYSDEQGRSYIFDCSQPLPQSKFPLPDHLNYPLCKYRYNSESVLNKSPIKSLKKLRDGFKKFKSKKNEKNTTSMSGLSSEHTSAISSTNYLDYFSEDEEEDNNTILDRLGSSPKHNKSFIKKIIGKVSGRSYSAHDGSTIKDLGATINQPTTRFFQRAESIRSIPDELQEMWSKFHEHKLDYCTDYQESSIMVPSMSRAISMPSIARKVEPELRERVLYVKEKITTKHDREDNYFSGFFKPIEKIVDRPKLSEGNDVITGVLGQSDINKIEKYQEAKQILLDATLSMATDTLAKTNTESEKEFRSPLKNNSHASSKQFKQNNDFNSYGEKTTGDYVRKISQHSMYAAPYEITHHSKQHFYNPQFYYGRQPVTNRYCSCCIHHQAPASYPYYPQTPYMCDVQVPNHSQTLDNRRVNYQEHVIAPLDIQMSCERKAERRKISDMVFDTFV